MKIYWKFSILVMSLFLFSGMAFSQETLDSFEDIKKHAENKTFLFEADQMLPLRGTSKVLNTDQYTLHVKEDKTEAYLPYYGRAYEIDYGGDGGIDFDASFKEYTVEIKDEKKRVIIEFKVKAQKDMYRCHLAVSQNGSATLTINSNNRESISYLGKLKKPGKKH